MNTFLLFWRKYIGVFCLMMVMWSGDAVGQFNIDAPATNYTQDFNTLASTGTGTTNTWTNNATLTGWYTRTDATDNIEYYNANLGNIATAALNSFGSNGSTERALGLTASNGFFGTAGTARGYIGWRLKNNTGVTLSSITVTYTGEQWRRESNASPQTLTVSYQKGTTVTDISSGAWTSVSTLTFTSPITGTATPVSLNGNTALNRTANISATINVTLLAGEEIMIRWVDFNDSGNDHSLAIDDVTVNASVDTTPPNVATLLPTGNATDVPINSNLALTFNENIVKGTGNILIKRSSDNSIFETIDVASGLVTVSTTTVTINPNSDFLNSTSYYVEIPNTAFKDAANNFYAGISGSSAWNFTTVASAGKVSVGSGNWNTAETWSPLGAPSATDNVTIAAGHTVTVTAPITRDNGTTTTVNTGGTLATNVTYTNNGTTTINGTFQINTGGFAGGSTDFTYGTDGILIFNHSNSAVYGPIDNFHKYWPSSNSLRNITLNANSPINLGVSRTVDGMFATASGITISGGNLTMGGICQINAGGFFNNSPIYGASSTLVYNTGDVYGRSLEFMNTGIEPLNIGSTPGYPNNVTLTNNTTLNYINGASGSALNKAMHGNLTIDSGSNFYMDYGSVASGGALTVKGNILNNGFLSLGIGATDHLRIGGNFESNGTFLGNGKTLFFIKNGLQTISSTNPVLTIPYIALAPTSGSTTLRLDSAVTLTAPYGGNVISFNSSSDVIDINSKTLTIGIVGVSNTIAGLGTFKGSTSSNLILLGNGSLGTLRFSTDFSLGNLTLNKQNNTIGFELGTNLTVATNLTLTNGLIDVDSYELTIGATGSITGASDQNFIIATASSNGRLRKNFNAAGSFAFPIGTSIASYTPATISMASLTSNGSISVNVANVKQDAVPLSPGHYINRYWNVTGSGIASANYSFTGTYLQSDVVGTEANSISLRRNVTNSTWLSGNTVDTVANTFTLTGMSTTVDNPITNTYQYTAGTIPAITITPASLSGFTYIYGSGSSAEQSFSVSGSNLTANIILDAPTNYEISLTSGSGYTSSINLPQTSGSIANTTIYVRLKPGLVVANYIENITATSISASNATLNLTGNVTQRALTIINTAAQSKAYDGNATATITGGTLVGVIAPDEVTISGGGTFATVNVGTDISVTAALTLGGAQAGNYVLTQPLGLSADITAIAPTITTSTINLSIGGNYVLSGANITSNSIGTFSYTLGTVLPSGSVTLAGNTLTGVAAGTAVLTVNQAAAGNYTAGSTTVAVVVSTINYVNGDYRTNPALSTSGNVLFSSANLISGVRPWQKYNGSVWVDITNSTESPASLSTKPENIFILSGSNLVDVAGGGTYNNIYVENNAWLYTASATGLNIASGKKLEIREGGYVTIESNGKFELISNASLIVKSGGAFDAYSSDARFLRGISSTISLENGGEFYVHNYLSKLWVGNENFASQSNFYIYNWDSTKFLYDNNISANSSGSIFGNLFIDTFGGSDISGNWNLFGPNTGTITLTSGDLVFESGQGNIRFFAETGEVANVTINGYFKLNSGWSSSRIVALSTSGTMNLSVLGDVIIDCPGDFAVKQANSLASAATLNIAGNLLINGTNTASSTNFYMNFQNSPSGGGKAIVNLKGNLVVATNPTIVNAVGSADVEFNFNGTNTQLVNVASIISGSNTDNSRGIPFYVKNEATVLLDENDLTFANGTSMIVESGGTINFGFTGTTSRIIKQGPTGSSGFVSQIGSTLKITSPAGIVSTGSAGNVQTTTRTFSDGGSYHYIGKANQVTGNALPAAASAKTVIVEMDTEALTLSPSATTKFTASGTLEIRKGTVIDSGTNFFADGDIGGQAGNLKMIGGFYKFNDVVSTAESTIYYPRLSGNYNLTGGEIELAANTAANQFQRLRGGKTYFNLKISGASSAGGYKDVSSAVTINNSLIITGTPFFNSGGSGVTGAAGVIMDGGRWRISKSTNAQPELLGTYALSGGIMEFKGSDGGIQSIRVEDGNANPINYNFIEITGTNVGKSTGEILLNSGGKFDVKTDGVFSINTGSISGTTGSQTLTVESGGTFKTGDQQGFSGGTNTSVHSNIENINLEDGSTVEYSRDNNQTITAFKPLLNDESNLLTGGYYNLKISGDNNTNLTAKTLPATPGDLVYVRNDLSVENPALLKIETDKTLIVNNKVTTVDSDDTKGILIKDSGSLVQIANVNNETGNLNTGNIKMERITKPMFRFDYTYWSSLVQNFILKSVSPTTLFDKFFSWNETTQAWFLHSGNASPLHIMEEGRGYIVRAPQSFPVETATSTPAQAITFTANFIGKPNNGTVTVPIFGSTSGQVADNKWNLLGNPYPSAIDADAFLDLNAPAINPILGGTLYFWTHNTAIGVAGSGLYSPNDYASWNGVGSTATSPGDGVINNELPSGKIAAGQGFFVKGVQDGVGMATFNNSMRVKEAGQNNQFFKAAAVEYTENTTPSEKYRVWLNMSAQPKGFNQLLVGYVENATNEFDNRFDGDSFGGNLVTFYSILDTKRLVIQGRALPFVNTDTVPLGYKTTLTGNLTISIDHVDGGMVGQDIYLQDNALNVVHNLTASNYVFATVPGTFNNRFVLRYLPQENLSNPSFDEKLASVTIYKNNTNLYVSSPYESIESISVYDLTGRLIFDQKNCNATRFETSELLSVEQALIVKVTLKNGAVVSEKVM